MEDDGLAGGLFLVPGIDHDHTGKLQALRRMHRHDRDRLGVAFHPPAHEFGLFVAGRERRDVLEHLAGVTAASAAGVAQEFDEVGEIDDPPVTPVAGGDPLDHRPVRQHARRHRGDAAPLEDRVKRGDARLHLLLPRFPKARHVGEVLAEEGRGGRPPGPARIARPLHGLE